MMDPVTRRTGLRLLGGAGALVAGAARARPANLTLRLADSLPHNHTIHRRITRPFIDAVARRSGGAVAIHHFPAEQLGKARDLLALTVGGMAHIGYVIPSYQSDRMPLSSALELPGIFADDAPAVRALQQLTDSGGWLERNEFTPNGLIPLITFVMPQYQLLFARSRPIASAADLAGLKMRSAGGAMDFLPRRLGMVPVRMTPPEVYEGLARGTIDGAILPYQSAVSYKLGTRIRQGTTNGRFGTVVLTYSMGRRTWARLPGHVRGVLREAGREVSIASATSLHDEEQTALANVRAEGLSQAPWHMERDPRLATVFRDVQAEWADSLDRRGKPGGATLAAVRATLRTSL